MQNRFTKTVVGAPLIAVIVLTLAGPPALAQVLRDGTIGALPPGAVDTEAGPGGGLDYLIREADGARAGNNLFHSFGQFDLSAGERAIYQGDASIRNLITRVTGGPSSIDGVIRSEIPGANLYFINPAGVLFGENAELDILGSFHVSTADRLFFDNGGTFEVITPVNATLSTEQVVGFGFLDAPASIEVRGSRLVVARNSDLSLTGGDLIIVGNRSDGTAGGLRAQSGRIDLASLRSGGEVYLDDNGVLRLANVIARGDVRISDNFTITTSGIVRTSPLLQFQPQQPTEGSGPVNVYAHDLTIEDADINTLTVTDVDAGDVTLDLDGDLVIRSLPGGQQSGIIAGTGFAIEKDPEEVLDPLNPFNVFVFDGSTQITVLNCLTGRCGIRYEDTGRAGDVNVRAQNVSFEDGGRITARSDGPGTAGTITLAVSDSIVFSGRAKTGERSGLASTADWAGNPGQIRILSRNADLLMHDQASLVIQNSAVSPPTSEPGLIEIQVANLDMSTNARIDSSTRGRGDGGRIDITATESVRLDGRTSDALFTGITTLSQPGSSGSAGSVRVETKMLTLTNEAEISARPVGPDATGDAGNLDFVVADTIRLRDSSISTESQRAAGGNINATFGRLLELERSEISASVTQGSESGGNVALTSPGTSLITLDQSSVIAQADQGFGGNILIEASLLLRDEASQISASSNVEGFDGVEEIRAPDGSLIDLAQDLSTPELDATGLLHEPCAAKRPSGASSLLVSSYSGLALGADSVLPAFLPPDTYAQLVRPEKSRGHQASADEAPHDEALALVDPLVNFTQTGRSSGCLN